MHISRMMTIAATLAFVSDAALAEDCNGSSARTYGNPVTVMKAEDGKSVVFINSTGVNSTFAPARMAGTNWQHCSGLLNYNGEDLVGGSGFCYTVRPDGDSQSVSWELKDGKGTWTQVTGTGIYEPGSSGTWAGSPDLGGLGTGSWEGDCG